jgi:septal ring factor EnvC (AmiA/AmiB activator)
MTGLIIKAVLALALLAAVTYGVHVVLEHFREEGRQEVRAKLQPQIDALTANLATSQQNEATLKKSIADANQYVLDLQAQASNARARAATALAAAAVQARNYEALAADFAARQAALPTADYAAACREAETLIDRLLAGSAP